MVPWAHDPESKTTAHYLLDVLCDMPGIIEDMRILQRTSVAFGNVSTMWTALWKRITCCLEALCAWRMKWENDHSHTSFLVGFEFLQTLHCVEINTYPFPTAIFFTKHGHVAELCLYNTLLILLYLAGREVPQAAVTESNAVFHQREKQRESNLRVLLAPGDGSIHDIICEICRMMFYQLCSYPGNTGAFQFMFPLQVAYRNAYPDSLEAIWLYRVISHIADVHGFEAVTYGAGQEGNTQGIVSGSLLEPIRKLHVLRMHVRIVVIPHATCGARIPVQFIAQRGQSCTSWAFPHYGNGSELTRPAALTMTNFDAEIDLIR